MLTSRLCTAPHRQIRDTLTATLVRAHTPTRLKLLLAVYWATGLPRNCIRTHPHGFLALCAYTRRAPSPPHLVLCYFDPATASVRTRRAPSPRHVPSSTASAPASRHGPDSRRCSQTDRAAGANKSEYEYAAGQRLCCVLLCGLYGTRQVQYLAAAWSCRCSWRWGTEMHGVPARCTLVVFNGLFASLMHGVL